MKNGLAITERMRQALQAMLAEEEHTYRELAKSLGCDAGSVHRWATGKTRTATPQCWTRLVDLVRRQDKAGDDKGQGDVENPFLSEELLYTAIVNAGKLPTISVPAENRRRITAVAVVSLATLAALDDPLAASSITYIPVVADGLQYVGVRLSDDLSVCNLRAGTTVLLSTGTPCDGSVVAAKIATGAKKTKVVMGRYYLCRRTHEKFILTAEGLEPLSDAKWILIARQAVVDLGTPGWSNEISANETCPEV